MRILQSNEGNSAAIGLQEWFAVEEIGISEMEGTDGGVASPLNGIIQKQAYEFFIFSKLPDESSFCLKQWREAFLPELLPETTSALASEGPKSESAGR